MKALVLEFQQSGTPRVAIAMFFQTEQIAVGGLDIGSHKHRPPTLENLIVGADADGGQVLLMIVQTAHMDCLLEDVVDLADRNWPVQQIVQLADPAKGAMADQRQPEDGSVQPLLGAIGPAKFGVSNSG